MMGWSFPENWPICNGQFQAFLVVQLKGAILQADGAKTVVARICDAIKAQIAKSVYPPGSRLPSSRFLAAELGVSRTTVTAAYDQLAAEGYLDKTGREGADPQGPEGGPASDGARCRTFFGTPVGLWEAAG
jgi:hypothetical protein